MAHKKIRNSSDRARFRRKKNLRKRISGTADKPRLSVFRSNTRIYAQAIDDVNNKVLASSSDLGKEIAGQVEGNKKSERAYVVGEAVGKALLAKDIKTVVFDRNGYLYHGRVKQVADGARSAGLAF